MINHKTRQNLDMAALMIWTKMDSLEKEDVLAKFPNAKDINDPEVKEFLFKNYREKLLEIVVK